MSILSKLFGFFGKRSEKPVTTLDLRLPDQRPPSSPSSKLLEDDVAVSEWFSMHQSCPDCGGRSFRQGPKGGASQNIQCENAVCGAKFNVLVVNGQFLFAQRIDERDRRAIH
jgi:hypothetical protein